MSKNSEGEPSFYFSFAILKAKNKQKYLTFRRGEGGVGVPDKEIKKIQILGLFRGGLFQSIATVVKKDFCFLLY